MITKKVFKEEVFCEEQLDNVTGGDCLPYIPDYMNSIIKPNIYDPNGTNPIYPKKDS